MRESPSVATNPEAVPGSAFAAPSGSAGLASAVLAACPDGVIAFDRELRYVAWNAAMEKLAGVPAANVLGRPAPEVFPFLVATGEEHYFREALAGREVLAADRPFHVPESGQAGYFEGRYAPLRAADGTVIGGVAVIRDVTQRVVEKARADEALRLHTLILERMTEGVNVCDEQGIIVYTNAAGDRMFGYEAGELVGRHVSVLNAYTPEENARIVDEVIADLRARGAWEGEFANLRRDGTPFTTRARITALESDAARYWVTVQEDVTERLRAEAALRESEARFRLMADTAPVMIWLADTSNRGTWFNQVWLAFTGRPLDGELGYGWLESVHPDDRERAAQHCGAAFDARRAFTMELRLRRHDGEWRWVLDHGVPRFDATGAFLGYIGSCIDITERHEVELSLRDQLTLTRAITEHVEAGLCLMDAEGRLRYMNPAAERTLGWRMSELRGKTLHDAVHYLRPDRTHFPTAECPLGRVLTDGVTISKREDLWIHRDGSFIPLLVSCAPIAREGKPVGAVLSFIDVTEQRQAKEALSAAKEAAEAANQAKSRFLSTMSHELRTPLNAIAGYTDLLEMELHGPLTGAQRDFLARIRRSGEVLLALISDVLEMARLDARQLELKAEAVLVSAVFDDLETLVGTQLRAKGLELVREDVPGLAVSADHDRLRQVLLNLLSNAVKFTPAGGRITVAARDDGPVVRIRVTDTGRGISPDQLATIFEPFVQIDRHLTHESQQGIGLGLAICRELTRRMGGDVVAESTPGKGSTFTVTMARS